MGTAKAFSVSYSTHSTNKEAGCAQGTGRGHSQESWRQMTKGMFHIMWHHSQYIKEEERESFGVIGFVLPSHLYCDGTLLSWGWLNSFPAMGTNFFFCLPCMCNFCFYQLCLSHFYSCDSVSHPRWARWLLMAGVKPRQIQAISWQLSICQQGSQLYSTQAYTTWLCFPPYLSLPPQSVAFLMITPVFLLSRLPSLPVKSLPL